MSANPQYEFSSEQNDLLGKLAGSMRFVGAFSIALGLLVGGVAFMQLLSGAWFAAVGGIGQGVLFFLSGLWIQRAAAAFQRVVDTKGRDIDNLMGAVVELRQVFTVQKILFVAATILAAVTVVLFVVGQGS